MKKILAQTIFLAVLLTCALLPGSVAAQQAEELKEGQKVLLFCNCFGPAQWVPGVIEKIIGPDDYQVRYGTGRYHHVRAGRDRIKDPAQAENENKQAEMRGAFWGEAGKYKDSIRSMMMIHDRKLRDGNTIYGPPHSPESWAKVMSDLTELDALCSSKFAGMKNDPSQSWQVDINRLPATWCEIAASRLEYEKKGRAMGAAMSVELQLKGVQRKLREILEDPDLRTAEEYQLLAFEREKWRAAQRAEIAGNFTKLDAEMPADIFAEIETLGDQLKARIEQTAPARSWKQPAYKDPGVEGLIRQQFAARFRGAQILKIGTSYADWKAYDAKTMVARDSEYEYYKIEKDKTRFKRGWMLVKVPNRPFCQSREWIVKQIRTGAGYSPARVELLGSAGIFMPCP